MEKKQLHSFYTCSGKCSDIPEAERARIQAQKQKTEGKRKGVDVFKHSWLTDRKTLFQKCLIHNSEKFEIKDEHIPRVFSLWGVNEMDLESRCILGINPRWRLFYA